MLPLKINLQAKKTTLLFQTIKEDFQKKKLKDLLKKLKNTKMKMKLLKRKLKQGTN